MSAALRMASVVELPPGLVPWGATVGALIRWDAARGPLVDYAGNPEGQPVYARALLQVDPADPAPGAPGEVLLAFADGDLGRPIVVGVLRPPAPAPGVDVQTPAVPAEALVDGRRVVLEAKDEIVLRCGEASITLRRNGRVVIRGAYVETAAKGVNRVKGGSVKIN